MSPRRKSLQVGKQRPIIDGLFTLTPTRYKIGGLAAVGERLCLEVDGPAFRRFIRDWRVLQRLRVKVQNTSVLKTRELQALRVRLAAANESFRSRYERAMLALYTIEKPPLHGDSFIFFNAGLFRKEDRRYFWQLVDVATEAERNLRPDLLQGLWKGRKPRLHVDEPSAVREIMRLHGRGLSPTAITRKVMLTRFDSDWIEKHLDRLVKQIRNVIDAHRASVR